MNAKQAHDIAEEIYWSAFQILDSEPEITGTLGGEIATAISHYAKSLLNARMGTGACIQNTHTITVE